MLVGLCGKAGSGKSVAGRHLRHTYGFGEYAFANRLKQVCMDLFGLTYDQCHTPEGKKEYIPQYDKTVRQILQVFATEVARNISPSIWCDYVMECVDAIPLGGIAITDVRFENEANAIRERNGILVKLVRPDHDDLTESEGDHKSEQLASFPDEYFDYVITANTGDLAKIKREIESLVGSLLEQID